MLEARVSTVNGRVCLVVNGRPTCETWAYGWPNAMPDFAAAGLRICQFHVAAQPWWIGPGRYDFAPIEGQIDAFLDVAPHALLIPRVSFGYEGEGWWAAANPDQLAVARNPAGQTLTTPDGGRLRVDVPQSAGSQKWTRDAARAMGDFVRHFERRNGGNVLGYQVGAGVSVEWFRWWTYVVDAYEDYAEVAQQAFRAFLRRRYRDDDALRRAWGRPDATLAEARVPEPDRLHAPTLGFLRDPACERDAIDWWDCLSALNAGQAVALCRAVKRACAGRKLAGVFYGYMFPHWNNQNPARTGHLALRTLLACDAIDYISSPYHYDNRHLGGVHHSQTVPQAIERAGKLHLDETDTATHLTRPFDPRHPYHRPPRDANETRALLRRDAAAVLGTAGSLWWMDLMHERWYADELLIAELRRLNDLAQRTLDWPCDSHAEAALVIDDRSWSYCDVNSNLNLYFTSLPRQFEWSTLGFPWDTLLLSELGEGGPLETRHYRLYVFLNAWRIDRATRRALRARLRRPGCTAVWFYAAGFYDERRAAPRLIEDATGVACSMQTRAVVPEIEISSAGHELIDEAPVDADGADEGAGPSARPVTRRTPRGVARFGARLDDQRAARTVWPNPRGWDTPLAPIFAVDQAARPSSGRLTVLGRFVHDGSAGLAVFECDGWRSVWCGAPMLPGWLMRRIALSAGVHACAPDGCVVHRRGPLLTVYAPEGPAPTPSVREPFIELAPCPEQAATPAAADRPPAPPPGASCAPRTTEPPRAGQTRFFLLQPVEAITDGRSTRT